MTLPQSESYREIPLTQGQVALVDGADFENLVRWRWKALWNNHTQSYYAVSTQIVDGKRHFYRMHRVILGLGFGDKRVGDHIVSGTTLDNRRSNLRILDSSENQWNRRRGVNRKTPIANTHVGIRRLWVANLAHRGKKIHIGAFKSRDSAIEAMRRAKLKYRGGLA